MSHSAGRYQQDLGFTDGDLFLGPGDIMALAATDAPIVRNAAGDISFNQPASKTVIYTVNLTNALLRREGFFEDLQEAFGGAGISGSAGFQGRPDTIPAMGAGQQLTPRAAMKLKGFKLTSIDVVYMITVAALTSQSIRVDQTNFIAGALVAPTAVLAPAANGLAIAFTGTALAQITNVALPAAQQIYRISNDSQLWIDLTVVTPVGSLFRLYGFDCNIEYNYN